MERKCVIFSVEAVNNRQEKIDENKEAKEERKKRLKRWTIRAHLRVTNYIVSVLNEQL